VQSYGSYQLPTAQRICYITVYLDGWVRRTDRTNRAHSAPGVLPSHGVRGGEGRAAAAAAARDAEEAQAAEAGEVRAGERRKLQLGRRVVPAE